MKYQFHKFKMHTNTCEAYCGIFSCKPMNALEPVVCTVFFKKLLSQLFVQGIWDMKGLNDWVNLETFRTFKRPSKYIFKITIKIEGIIFGATVHTPGSSAGRMHIGWKMNMVIQVAHSHGFPARKSPTVTVNYLLMTTVRN